MCVCVYWTTNFKGGSWKSVALHTTQLTLHTCIPWPPNFNEDPTFFSYFWNIAQFLQANSEMTKSRLGIMKNLCLKLASFTGISFVRMT